MTAVKKHVEEWFKDLPNTEQSERMKEDIIQSLEDRVYDLILSGKAEEDAVNKALVEFGDLEDIKVELGAQTVTKRNPFALHLGFSLWGTVLIIALVLFINFYYTPDVIWFVYPTFAVLWWPLSIFYKWLGRR
ncbi:permease prefix domain 1-containing protein [Paenibacillus sp. NFR01]|uniref:permease prefix domain 1-containing protein n=1 Tax=Paenibacillus sp. NFR01 TaxID=1566279 RepID=UPI0008D06B1E|nr:permease prefix domain 1-containing protein [Paenibacillus sp. NFR01]SEU19964.1 hypothetical protein SAMN03159358_3935 [Paenibacillus sp. NFR01]